MALAKSLRILLIEGGLPSPQVDAGSVANLDLIALLQSLGHRVSYLFTGYDALGSEAALHACNCEIINGAGMSCDEQHAVLSQHPWDLVIVSRPGPALQWLAALQATPIPVVYFGHDVHHERLLRASAFLPDQTRIALVHKAIEVHIWQCVDAVIYPTAWECALVEKITQRQHAIQMPLYALDGLQRGLASPQATIASPRTAQPQEAKHLLFVGGSRHAPNRDGVDWFLQAVAPHLNSPWVLTVIGHWEECAKAQLLAKASERIAPLGTLQITGSISDAALQAYYQQSDLVIAPLRFGAGLKRKVVEALMQERPLVTTPIGIEGIELSQAQQAWLSSEPEPRAFANHIMRQWALSPAIQTKRARALAQTVGLQFSTARRVQSLWQMFAMLGIS